VRINVGPDFDARKKEALKLMEDGYAQHLLIPAYGQAFDAHLFSNFLACWFFPTHNLKLT